MSHLSHAELAEAAAGVLERARGAHLDGCAACRDHAGRLAATLAAVRDVEVPEPSPLYWDHLSARIRARVADEAIVPAWRAGWRDLLTARTLVPAASAVAVAGAVIVSGLMTRDGRVGVPPAPVVAVSADAMAPDDSEAWQMLTSAAAETPIEDAHAAGMGVPVGAVDRAVQRMTPDELTALGRLLQDELRRSGD